MLIDNFNTQMERTVQEHEREMYELRGAKSTVVQQLEELKANILAKTKDESYYKSELGKLKSTYEKDQVVHELKLSAKREKLVEKDQKIKELQEKLAAVKKDSRGTEKLKEYIEELERQKDELQAKLTSELEALRIR